MSIPSANCYEASLQVDSVADMKQELVTSSFLHKQPGVVVFDVAGAIHDINLMDTGGHDALDWLDGISLSCAEKERKVFNFEEEFNFHLQLDRSDSGVSTLASSGHSPVLSMPVTRRSLARRQSSKCSLGSLSSVDTSLSEDISDIDDEMPISFTLGDTLYQKESMWGKLRKVVKWSPFMQSYRKKYPWIQLAGHPGGFKAGLDGSIFKKSCKLEQSSMHKLKEDVLRPFVPEYRGERVEEGDTFIEMQDLLCEFQSPCVMDCKMGTRTYLEDEVEKAGKPRRDLYQKMIAIDPSEPTDDENSNGAVTKQRYMIWREELSSSASLGFRIEGIKRGTGDPERDFKKVRTKEDVARIFQKFTCNRRDVLEAFAQRLRAIQAALEVSVFFRSHEVIGSSLLFVYDHTGKAGVWLIDFGKTTPLPDSVTIDHESEWILGNHEDGYLVGLRNIIEVIDSCQPGLSDVGL